MKNIVLVHGAWADGSSWSAVIEILQKAGYNATAVQTAMTSLDGDVATVRNALAAQNGPTILVAHSFGGAVITRLGADAPNVVGLVYESAFAPDQGETLKALINGGPQPAVAAAFRPDAQGNIWLDPAGVLKYFAPDVDPIKAKVLAAVQKPIAASEFFDDTPYGVPAWKSLPSWFIMTTDDQVVPPAAQQFFAQRMGAKVTSIASSHVAMISHPDVVAGVIMSAATSINGVSPAVPITPVVGPATTPAPAPVPGSGSQLFPTTGKTVRGAFLDYWNANGGLAQFGYPISDEIGEKSPIDGKTYTVQYFERAEFELHPDNQAPYNVLLSLLGSMRYNSVYAGK